MVSCPAKVLSSKNQGLEWEHLIEGAKSLLHLTLSIRPNSNGRNSADIGNWAMVQVGHTLFRQILTTFVWGIC